MCYRFTTPLRRRPAHGFAFRQAETLDAFAGSSFSAATRATGLASEERGQSPGSRFRVPASRLTVLRHRRREKRRDWDVSQSRHLWGG